MQVACQSIVVHADGVKGEHQERQDEHHHPRPVDELADHDDAKHGSRGDCAQEVRGHMPLPAAIPTSPPMAGHASLRQSERGESADGEQGHKRSDAPAEDHDQDGRDRCDHNNAVAEGQPRPAYREGMRQVAVGGQQRQQTWEIRETGVGSQNEQEQS